MENAISQSILNNSIRFFWNEEMKKSFQVSLRDGAPWFVGKEVATALGYSNPRDAIARHVDNEDKDTVVNHDGTSGNPNITIINESGLYSLVMGSKLPGAKRFKRWVTAEVLPTIRKTGGYVNDEDAFVRTYLPNVGPEVKALFSSTLAALREANARIEADKPKVLFADAVSAAHTSILVGELAKLLRQNGVDIGQNRLFQYLREKGYLIRRSGSDFNLPTQRAMDMGLFEIKETVINQSDGSIRISKTTKVTGKGQQYFINQFMTSRT